MVVVRLLLIVCILSRAFILSFRMGHVYVYEWFLRCLSSSSPEVQDPTTSGLW